MQSRIFAILESRLGLLGNPSGPVGVMTGISDEALEVLLVPVVLEVVDPPSGIVGLRVIG